MSEEKETTNAVLKATMDGLAKLTDTQLGHINETLKDMKILMSGFATKIEVDELKKDIFSSIKRIEDWQVNHEKDDKDSFGTIDRKQNEARDFMIRWGAVAGVFVTALSLLSPVILKYIFKV